MNQTKPVTGKLDHPISRTLTAGIISLAAIASPGAPNVVIVLADQWRQQATGFNGDPNVQTPNLDSLAAESINFVNAVSGCPVCSPYRASLLTGQYPLTHGVFVNDVPLRPKGPTLAMAFKKAGYDTAFIGKLHVDGHGRSSFIPPQRHLGFDYWKGLECTHAYNHSVYYEGDCDARKEWDGYDAIAQTNDAMAYIRNHASGRPFLLYLSWGPPHAPYGTAPEKYRNQYSPEKVLLRPNVPGQIAEKAREWLAGYYAHCSALDDCIGELVRTLAETGLADNTILLFTSDHGDMLGSQGNQKKQQPWDESIRVPFLLRYPGLPDRQGRRDTALINAPDIMPTLLGLSGIDIPDTVEGSDFSGLIKGGPDPSGGSALLQCPHPFGQWNIPDHHGREYRGLRTTRYTYVRDLRGPWLLYDNQVDPYQLHNLVNDPSAAEIRKVLDKELTQKLKDRGDEFLPGSTYLEKWGYRVDKNGTVPYTN